MPGQDALPSGCVSFIHYCATAAHAQSPTLPQRRAAHFNATAVHASFGDVELAQITLRGARATCMHVGTCTVVHVSGMPLDFEQTLLSTSITLHEAWWPSRACDTGYSSGQAKCM